MTAVDLGFRLQGTSIPADHGYRLFAAVQQIIPEVHGDADIGIHPISGRPIGSRQLRLTNSSQLVLRLPVERVREVLPLAGKTLRLGSDSMRVGVPQSRALVPAAALRSRLVVIKGFMEPETFLEAVTRQLQTLGIQGKPSLVKRRDGPSMEGRREATTTDPYVRRTIRIRDKEVVGFALVVSELTADESIRLQEAGLGGRRRFGCGIFVPKRW